MGLYERWTDNSETGNKISIHAFGAALSELACGAVVKSQLVAAFSLDASDQTQLDEIIATYQALGTNLEKAQFIGKLEDVMILCESGFYTKSKAASELGFTE